MHCINWPDGINNNNLELIWDLRHKWRDLFHQTINTALITSLKLKKKKHKKTSHYKSQTCSLLALDSLHELCDPEHQVLSSWLEKIETELIRNAATPPPPLPSKNNGCWPIAGYPLTFPQVVLKVDWYPFIGLCRDRHFESEVPWPTRQYNAPQTQMVHPVQSNMPTTTQQCLWQT